MKKNLLIPFLSFLTFALFGQITTVGIIGDAVNGWSEDVDMTQDTDNPAMWRATYDLKVGPMKFRAENDWAINWGSKSFPAGLGTQGGPDIQVSRAGMYNISLNAETGIYYLEAGTSVGIIGEATLLGWGQDIDMFPVPDSTDLYTVKVDLTAGKCKFRLDNDWATAWGSSDFPSGIALTTGGDIIVTTAGEYNVTFSSATGAFTFEATDPYKTIGIIGDAVNGWMEDVDMTRNNTKPSEWVIIHDLKEGPLKFRANNDWPDNWGGTSFPSGAAVPGSNDNIPVSPAGKYRIVLDVADLTYDFNKIEEYASINITGSAVKDFETFRNMNRLAADGYDFELRTELNDGELIFTANENVNTFWGAGDFPSGVALSSGALIPVPAGEYLISFNYVTGAYNFKEIIEYDKVSLVGKSGPFGAWPDANDNGAKDFYLDKSAADGNLWTGAKATMTDFSAATDGGVKFRAETDWAVNWGAVDFPSGKGTANGPNINVLAGTYDIAFNSGTGEYVFSISTGTKDIITPADIVLSPNPVQTQLKVTLPIALISGDAALTVYDVAGRQVSETTITQQESSSIDVSKLREGSYFMQIKGQGFLIGKQFFIVK